MILIQVESSPIFAGPLVEANNAISVARSELAARSLADFQAAVCFGNGWFQTKPSTLKMVSLPLDSGHLGSALRIQRNNSQTETRTDRSDVQA